MLNSTYHGNGFLSGDNYSDKKAPYNNYRAPETEAMNRSFTETARYYNVFNYQKKHGTKYITPPVADNIQQLRDERDALHRAQTPNYLLNARYAK